MNIRKITTLLTLLLVVSMGAPSITTAQDDPHGLSPAADMTFMPHLAGLRNKTFKNLSGQSKALSEAIVLRGSEIKEGKASIAPGGLFYISETSDDARPFRRDPFLILGEHAYLVDLKGGTQEYTNISLNKGDRLLLGESNHRLWFDYVTDHYEVPYGEFALISPSGGWLLEFPVATDFPPREEVGEISLEEGSNPQLEKFYLDNTYYLGASRYEAEKITFDDAVFKSLRFPEITEATFSMQRPIILEVRQEDYRLYFDKRIYASRQPDGFLVTVTNFTGSEVLAEKVIKPITAQEYKNRLDKPEEMDKYHLTIPEEDIRIEIVIDPAYLKDSDFTPWSSSHTHGFPQGYLSFVVYRDLVTVKNNEAWPLDDRWNVILEPQLKTGMLHRLVIENNQPITFDNTNTSYDGPIKYSNIWNRKAFTVVADDFDEEEDVVRNLYVRDYYFMRTDNMVFWPEEGRINMDFFLGSSPVLEPIIERSFLTRLADTSYGTVVEGSHFTSHPQAVSDASFYEPEHTAPFVPRVKGLMRKTFKNTKGERLLAAEAMMIRGSYVDYKNERIVIPPAGLVYTSRNARNLRTLSAEPFFMLGKTAYLTEFSSETFVRKNFDLDLWKNQKLGDGNIMYWQDELLGVRNKALRFTSSSYLDDRPVASLSLMKYSGNRWAAHFYMSQGLPEGADADNRYHIPELFAEGATYIQPEYIGSNYVKIKEFGTPGINALSYTYDAPQILSLAIGETMELGDYTLRVDAANTYLGTVTLTYLQDGQEVGTKVIGPLNEETIKLLPQHEATARSLQYRVGKVMAEIDVVNPFSDGKINFHLFTGIQDLERDTPFEHDSRFMVRPDVCGHCYQLNEILLDNPEPIYLDKDNPVYEGPRDENGDPIFKIVVDSFDGEQVLSWYIETEYRGKVYQTDNLAFNPRDNIDVLAGVNGTIEGNLRLSMLPRLAYMEYWRTGQKAPAEKISGSVNTGGSAHIGK